MTSRPNAIASPERGSSALSLNRYAYHLNDFISQVSAGLSAEKSPGGDHAAGVVRSGGDLETFNVYAIAAAWSAQPPSAVRMTTSQGGVFQNTSSVNAARARPKSAADKIALVQTGS